ncbi:cyclase family protein [Salisaeta longa]|uniref:cyclase family protein n=1 Tax=Salisaeta longa TaxID=503170 RepID=UPI0003B6C9A6|nr:cyclase family protein [Salisaeta longa]
MDLIDISRPAHPSTAAWPGDQPFNWSWTARMGAGAAVNVGAYTASTHHATHVDAPLHYTDGGADVTTWPLAAFVGPAEVVKVTDDRIEPSAVAEVRAPRVLFQTSHSNQPSDVWHDDFPAIAPATIEALAARGTVLIGTDAPSVDPVDSKTLPAHQALGTHRIPNLENLDLSGVAPGRYRLLAMPLYMPGADAAPVRAVLAPRE